MNRASDGATPPAAGASRWVWIFGEIAGLRWVIDRGLMAFSVMSPRVGSIQEGDQAVLYVARGAFHNPTRDRARLVGVAEVLGSVQYGAPVTIAGRDFEYFAPIRFLSLLPERRGPLVAPLAPELSVVRKKRSWGQYFRSSPVLIGESDFDRLVRAIDEWDGEAHGA